MIDAITLIITSVGLFIYLLSLTPTRLSTPELYEEYKKKDEFKELLLKRRK